MSIQVDKNKSQRNLSLPLSQADQTWLKGRVRDIPDFPKPGIIFKDLTPLLKDAEALAYVIDVMTENCKALKPNLIAGIEARGFILAPTIAYNLGVGFVPIRKPGKLPYDVQRLEYALEYGTDTVEIHADAVTGDDRVVLIDDLLATGGTAAAATSLLELLACKVVGIGFIIDLAFLGGRNKLSKDAEVFSLIAY